MVKRSVLLARKKTFGDRQTLTYKAVPSDLQQAGKAGDVLTPDVEIGSYRVTAVVDWCEVEFRFAKNTQFQHVQTVLTQHYRGDRRTYVDPVGAGPGNVANTFKIRFQEPRKDLLQSVLRALDHRFQVLGSTTTAIEISVDFYPRTPSDAARERIFGVLARSLFLPSEAWTGYKKEPRFAWGAEGKDSQLFAPDAILRGGVSQGARFGVPYDATFYLGQRDGPRMWRLMDKIIDRQRFADDLVQLNDEEKRVRLEVTLRDHEVAKAKLGDPEQLFGYNFTQLQRECFSMKLPVVPVGKDPISSVRRVIREQIFLRGGVIALTAKRVALRSKRKEVRNALVERAKQAGRRAGLPRVAAPESEQYGLVSYIELSKEINDALSKLSRHWR